MSRRGAALSLLMALALAAWPAAAQRQRLDDTGSRVLSGNVRMKWDDALPQGDKTPTVSGSMDVMVRLDVRAWRGRNARIFMVLPPQPFGRLSASWETRGILQPGQLVSGDTGGLVHAGPIQADFIEDLLRIRLQADGSRLQRVERLDFAFQIEVLP